MSYTLVSNGNTSHIQMGGPRRFAEILSEEEYDGLCAGSLIGVTADGALLDPSSPLQPGAEIILRPPDFDHDFVGFGFQVNNHGETVNLRELLAIRAYKQCTGKDLSALTLTEIRSLVAAK